MPPVSCERESQCAVVLAGAINRPTNGGRRLVLLTAMAMARLASVTVSMGEEMKGVFMVICLVSAEVKSWTKDVRRIFDTQ